MRDWKVSPEISHPAEALVTLLFKGEAGVEDEVFASFLDDDARFGTDDFTSLEAPRGTRPAPVVAAEKVTDHSAFKK